MNQISNEVNQDRQRLTTVLDNIAKVRSDYAADGVTPEIVVYVPSLNEADLLIRRLEGTRLATSPYEKIGVAQGFNQVNEPNAAIDLLSRAEAQSATSERLADRTDSSRMLAISYYLAGRPEDGDRALQRSLDYVALAPPGYSEALRNGFDYTTYLVWVEQNLDRDDCPAARAHLDLLKKTADRLPTLGRGVRADSIQAKELDLGKVCQS